MGREGWPSPRPLSRKRRVNSTTEYGKGGDFLCRIPPCRRRICRAPVAAVLATSGLLALLVFAQPLSPTRLARGMQFALFAMSGLGFLSSIFLTCIEALVLHAWCAWCVVSALAVSFIFLLATLEAAWPGPPASPLALLRAVRTNLALSAVAVIIGVPAFFWLSRHGEPSPLEQASHQLLDQRL